MSNTTELQSMINDLKKCTFAVGSFDKRFVRDISARLSSGMELTPKQAALIQTMHYRYRRQHGKLTPNYDPKADPKAHRSDKLREEARKLQEWNEASKR